MATIQAAARYVGAHGGVILSTTLWWQWAQTQQIQYYWPFARAQKTTDPDWQLVDLKEQIAQKADNAYTAVYLDQVGLGPVAPFRYGAQVALMPVALTQEAGIALFFGKTTPKQLRGQLSAYAQQHAHVLQEQAYQELKENTQWRIQSDTAQIIAQYLSCHPKVSELRYPGLKQDVSFSLGARQLQGGFGPWLSYRLTNQQEWTCMHSTAEDARVQIMKLEERLALL